MRQHTVFEKQNPVLRVLGSVSLVSQARLVYILLAPTYSIRNKSSPNTGELLFSAAHKARYTIQHMSQSDWAKQRQMLYGAGVVLFFVLLIAPFVFYAMYDPASCFDGKLNQDETAIDRGGPCQLLDENFVQPHAVLWSRSFPVREGFYNAVAYIENPNQEGGIYDVAYQFKLYDDRNILIAERYGRTPVFPGNVFPIFESGIDTGNRVPVRTFFSFVEPLVWERMTDPTLGIVVQNERLSDLDTAPRLEASVHNNTVLPQEDLVIVATLFGVAGNAIASSRTIIDNIEPGQETAIAFTWPRPFTDDVARVDIVPLALPARSQ